VGLIVCLSYAKHVSKWHLSFWHFV